MKLKILILTMLLFSLNVYSQEQKIGVELSLKDSNVRVTAKNIPVKVKITNLSDKLVFTSDFQWLMLSLSKCPQADKCQVRGETSAAFTAVKSQNLSTFQAVAFEFEVDLADLYWNDLTSSNFDFNQSKNLLTVSSSQKYLSATLVTSSEEKAVSNSSIDLPVNKSFVSNVIELKLLF